MIRNALFLASRYLRSSWIRTAVLVAGVMVAAFLPVFTFLSADLVEGALMRRAEASPILLGAKGNEFDMTLSSLYFRGQVTDHVPNSLTARGASYGTAVPLLVGYRAANAPIVGTTLEYFEVRGLQVRTGRLPALLGEVIVGAKLAERHRLQAGDELRSDLTNLYNLAGSYPIMLKVVGVLAEAGSPDDEAFFADLKTTWVLDGRLHGHAPPADDEIVNRDARIEGENLEATAAIFLFTEFNESNLDSFHMHGDKGEAPLSAVLVFPRDQRAHDQLLGDFALEDTLQAVRPADVLRTVLAIVLRVREGLTVYFATVAVSTAAFFGLIISLSLRLRKRELALMRRIGCSRSAIATIVSAEIGLVVLGALILTSALTWTGLAVLRAQLGL